MYIYIYIPCIYIYIYIPCIYIYTYHIYIYIPYIYIIPFGNRCGYHPGKQRIHRQHNKLQVV